MPIIYGTPLTPPKMSDEGQGSRTSIAHHHPAPKGESGPNPSGRPFDGGDNGVQTTPAIPRGLNWGSDAHGQQAADRINTHGGTREAESNRGPKHVSSRGHAIPSDAHKYRAPHG